MSFRELRSVASPLSMNTLETVDTLEAGGSLYYSPGLHTATRPYSAAGDTSAAPAAAAIPPFSCVPLAGCPDTAFALVSATSLPSPGGVQGVTLQPIIFRRSSCVVYTPSDNGEAPAAPAPVEDALFDRMELEDCPLAPGCPSVSGEALLLVDGRLLAEMSAAAQGGPLGDELTLEAMADGSMEGPALFACAVTGANEAAAVEALCPEPGVFEGWEEVPRLPRR
ncbi:hypothetical protein HYH03_003608 [Edaphochlamys debaryana]|uniref:Uncharacterized protein n=1 Tax=Edaphochlamys debaryana TaxID=47281 RepID=A0A835YIM9_9CHLO|nr:hypothetical protein HYH03_003608 [Edaphochlamys debaryana]|eukprot:KAG2498349.1 hypothetical protein HYH03_003608 [Edaphochlamys debaryana]